MFLNDNVERNMERIVAELMQQTMSHCLWLDDTDDTRRQYYVLNDDMFTEFVLILIS